MGHQSAVRRESQSQALLGRFVYMNGVLDKMECKLFHPLNLRTSIVSHYATIDTALLMSFFATKGTESANQERFWNRLFNLDKRVFRQKG